MTINICVKVLFEKVDKSLSANLLTLSSSDHDGPLVSGAFSYIRIAPNPCHTKAFHVGLFWLSVFL